MVYVGLAGPKVFGVFETVEMAVDKVAELAEVTYAEVKVTDSYSGDLLCLVNGYPQARLVKTIFY